MAWTTPRTWVTGEVVTSAMMNTHVRDNLNYLFNSGMRLICAQTALSAQASFDTNTILGGLVTGGYTHLIAYVQLRGDAAVTSQALGVRLNNDTTANYDSQSQALRGTNANSSGAAGTSISVAGLNCASDTTGAFMSGRFDFPAYAAAIASVRKQVLFQGWGKDIADGTAGSYNSIVGGGEWRSTGLAINRITLFPASGNFIAGSYFSLYGLI